MRPRSSVSFLPAAIPEVPGSRPLSVSAACPSPLSGCSPAPGVPPLPVPGPLAFHSFRTFPSRMVWAAGHGSSARIARSMAAALRVQSIRPVWRLSIFAYGVGLSVGWGVKTASPFSIFSMVRISRSFPVTMRLVEQAAPCLLRQRIGTVSCSMMSPVSNPSPICMMVMPVSGSPSRMDHWMGAAPLHLGSREACTFRHPYFGISRMLFGMI